MVKVRIENETKEEKFKRLAEARVNKLLEQFAILRNCSNTQVYSYSEPQINKIFKALEEELRITKAAFQSNKKARKGIKL
ncbi:hypothetical protein HYY69_01110 [Candidatus Woesearchaeota archaeon]|nr:hypothetical protein [Candidatus Woesearchaeota archaeon]